MSELSPLDEILRKGEQARELIKELRQAVKDARVELRTLREEHEEWIAENARAFTDQIEEWRNGGRP